MSYKWASKVVAILAGVCVCVGLFAQDQPKSAPAATKDLVRITAKVSRFPIGDDKTEGTYKIVQFAHNDTVVSSDLVTYDRKTKIAISPGKINITDPECDITGDKGNADFNKKISNIEGNVTMLLKPKQDSQPKPKDNESLTAKMKKPTTVTCPKIEYLYKNKIATLTGGVNFKQEKRSASSNKAVYDGKAEILTLTGDVKGVDEDGQTFSATTVKISFKKGDEWMELENANANVKVDLGEEDSKAKTESP